MAEIPTTEREWNLAARAQNYKCVSCGEVIPFEGRELFLERGLCSYCAQMIAKKDDKVSA
jgi:RNA polymerase-binding transcription factor DksA